MNNLLHNFLIFISAITIGISSFIAPLHKAQPVQHKVVVSPTVTIMPTKAISADDVAQKVLLIQKQTYQSYQQCLTDEKKNNPCTTSTCNLSSPTPDNIAATQGSEENYLKLLQQAKCQLSCQKQQQTDCYNKYYGENSNVVPPLEVSKP